MRHLRLLVVLAATAALAAGAARSGTDAPQYLSAYGTADVDGVNGPGEWSSAGKIDFLVRHPPSTEPGTPAQFLVMNDAANIYFAYQVWGPVPGGSSVGVNVDNDGVGTYTGGDDSLVLSRWFGLVDNHASNAAPCPSSAWCFIEDVRAGGTNDGTGAARYDGTSWFYELSHPLDSADDAHDFSLRAGDAIALTDRSEVALCDGVACRYTSLPHTPLYVVIAPLAPPVVSSIEPTRARPGDVVTLAGSRLLGTTSVTFGGVAAAFTVDTPKEISATVPTAARTGRVTVTTPGGTSATARDFVVVTPRPVIGPAASVPAKPVAGRAASVSFALTRSDTGARLKGARVVCTPSIAGNPLPHTERYANGILVLRFRIPRSAAGRQLRVLVRATFQSQTASRVSTFRIG